MQDQRAPPDIIDGPLLGNEGELPAVLTASDRAEVLVLFVVV